MIIGIDTGARDYESAEHVAHTLPGVLGLTAAQRREVVISTHVARGGLRRDAVAITVPNGWAPEPEAAGHTEPEAAGHTEPETAGHTGRGAAGQTEPEAAGQTAGEARREAATEAGRASGAEALARRVLAAMPESSAVVSMSGGAADAFTAGPPAGLAGAWAAAVQAATRSAGRLVHYPGRERLTGRFPVGEITVRADIDEVRLVGSPTPPDPTVEFDTRDYVRPIWHNGLVVLLVQPNAGGTVAPFEIEHPPRCCDAH